MNTMTMVNIVCLVVTSLIVFSEAIKWLDSGSKAANIAPMLPALATPWTFLASYHCNKDHVKEWAESVESGSFYRPSSRFPIVENKEPGVDPFMLSLDNFSEWSIEFKLLIIFCLVNLLICLIYALANLRKGMLGVFVYMLVLGVFLEQVTYALRLAGEQMGILAILTDFGYKIVLLILCMYDYIGLFATAFPNTVMVLLGGGSSSNSQKSKTSSGNSSHGVTPSKKFAERIASPEGKLYYLRGVYGDTVTWYNDEDEVTFHHTDCYNGVPSGWYKK